MCGPAEDSPKYTPVQDPCRVHPDTPKGRHITIYDVTAEEAEAINTFFYSRRTTSPEARLTHSLDFNGRIKKPIVTAADYVENLKTLPLDVLHQARANASMTDMWKYSMISDEIEDRKNR